VGATHKMENYLGGLKGNRSVGRRKKFVELLMGTSGWKNQRQFNRGGGDVEL